MVAVAVAVAAQVSKISVCRARSWSLLRVRLLAEYSAEMSDFCCITDSARQLAYAFMRAASRPAMVCTKADFRLPTGCSSPTLATTTATTTTTTTAAALTPSWRPLFLVKPFPRSGLP